MSRRGRGDGGGFATVFLVLLVIGFVIKFIWWILGILALVAVFHAIGALSRHEQTTAIARNLRERETAQRADQQHEWVLAGDDRGVYGAEGARLMHYIQSEGP